MSVNRVILVGNVGKDPETSTFQDNVKVARFSLATSETYKDKSGEKVTTTEWHTITAWRGLGEMCEKWIKKGMQVYIEGKLKTSSYEKEGVKHYSTVIVAETIQMLGKKESPEANQPKEEKEPTYQSQGYDKGDQKPEEDDLPF